MIGPFNLMPMCDCTTDEKTKKKVCKPFLRAFVYDCNGLKVVGDYDYDADPYKTVGEVTSEAKCCDCADCGCGSQTSKACYDIHCLLRQQELNGGLTNLQITGADGTRGPVVTFSPPTTSLQVVIDRLNSINYLGFDKWTTSGPGLLCVEFKKGEKPPGQLTSCRFKRYTLGTNQSNWLSLLWYTDNADDGITNNADTGAVLAGNLPANIASSQIHYFCNIEVTDLSNNANLKFAPADLSNTRLFRSSYNNQSIHSFVQLSTGALATDILAGANITVQNINVINAFPAWLTSAFASPPAGSGATSIPASVSISQIVPVAPLPTANFRRFTVVVELPCRYDLKSIGNLMAMNTLEVSSTGAISGTGLNAGHKHNFVQDTSVGIFVATPSVDGTGGSTNTDSSCNETVPVVLGGADTNLHVSGT